VRRLDLPTLGPQEMRRILAVTDALGLHRESVRIPLTPRGGGGLRVTGAFQVEIVVPAGADFETWVAELPERLRSLDLAGVRRTS
jgi:hypothetical protein